jgi:hypothetical protein
MPSFTPDSALDLLFSPDLISAQVKKELHEDIHVSWPFYMFLFLLFYLSLPLMLRCCNTGGLLSICLVYDITDTPSPDPSSRQDRLRPRPPQDPCCPNRRQRPRRVGLASPIRLPPLNTPHLLPHRPRLQINRRDCRRRYPLRRAQVP